MYSEAFFESDINKIIDAGLRCIPNDSQYHECITDVVRWHKENPNDWQKTWELVNEKYQLNPDYRRLSCSGAEADFNIDAKINGAYIVMGLLYGKGDPDETVIISTRGGQDSDCNPSNAAGVLFTTLGFEQIPEKFKSQIDNETKFSWTEYDFPGLIEVSEKLARDSVVRAGGSVEKDGIGKEYFVIPQVFPTPSELEQSWNPGATPEDVSFSDEELDQIKIRVRSREEHVTQWELAGPYTEEGKGVQELFDIPFAPETKGWDSWRSLPPGEDKYSHWTVRFDQILGGQNRVAYVRTKIWSESDREAVLELGSDDGAKVWLNGGIVHSKNVHRAFQDAEDLADVHLKEGWNTLMIKVTQGSGEWLAAAVLVDTGGKPIPGLKYKTD
jgi:hypothetical protein